MTREEEIIEYMKETRKPFPEDRLPAPRLELRWTQKGPDLWWCTYNLVMVLGPYDIRHTRRNEFSGRYAEKTVKLGATKCTRSHHPLADRQIDTPFRNGVHIRWDAAQLRLPLYVVVDGVAQALTPRQKDESP